MPELRAFLFANGDLRDAGLIRQMIIPGDLLIAADRGLQHLQTLGLPPGLIVGDLDSAEQSDVSAWQAQGVPVRRFPARKDQTDLELALEAALEAGCRWMRIVAGLGGRLDHTLGNLALLADPRLKGMDVRLDDGVEEVLLARVEAGLQGMPGDRVSLLPWGVLVEGVTTHGLSYPLREETLYPYRARGISNEMTGRRAQIRLSSGQLLVMHTRLSLPEEL